MKKCLLYSLLFILIVGAYVLFTVDVKTEFYVLARHYKYGKMQIFEDQFAKKIKNPPQWILDRVRAELAPFEKITYSLDHPLLKEKGDQMLLVKFKIQNGKLKYEAGRKIKDDFRFHSVYTAFKKLTQITKVPDVEFFVCLEDSIESIPFTVDVQTPIFVFAKKAEDWRRILIPDYDALLGNRYPKLSQTVIEANKTHPWEQKMQKAIWRGTTTGGHFTEKNWREFPRSKFVMLAQKNSNQIDAFFNNVCQQDPLLIAALQKEGLLGDTVTISDHIKCKYLVDVDGNTCGYSRCFWSLLSNSVVLKQATNNIQWYYNAIIPYEHYIPVNEDFSNLVEQILWAKNHDEECRMISEKATAFVQDNLSQTDMLVYLKLLLEEYSKLENRNRMLEQESKEQPRLAKSITMTE